MEIFLLRHGLAAERNILEWGDDSTRPLTAKGKKELKKISAAMERMDLDFDLILSSPFLRAKETAEIVATNLKLEKRLKFSEALTPEKPVEPLIRQLQKLKLSPGKILLVGHEPSLSQLISWLTTGDMKLELDLKKGGLAKLEVKKLSVGKCAALAWLLTPKQMKWMV